MVSKDAAMCEFTTTGIMGFSSATMYDLYLAAFHEQRGGNVSKHRMAAPSIVTAATLLRSPKISCTNVVSSSPSAEER